MTFRAAIALAFFAGLAEAQNLEKFVVTGEAAKKAMTKTEISGDTAEKITQACVDFAKQHNIAVSVFVISPSGQIVHAHRMDGQLPINIETGLMKAQSALYTRTSTHEFANRVANNLALQMRWDKLPIYPVSGGLPIIVDNQLIGAIGVGGSNMDEECAYEALTKVLGPQPPLTQNRAGNAPAPPSR
jgi:uncharacterized protein GlcG (DUF336 family)